MAKFELQQNGLMISNGEEDPDPLSLTCQLYREFFFGKFRAFQI